jgi:ribosomal protein L30/L7E
MANMPANGLTKALPLQKHKKFVEMLGLQDIRTQIEVGNNFKSS